MKTIYTLVAVRFSVVTGGFAHLTPNFGLLQYNANLNKVRNVSFCLKKGLVHGLLRIP